MRITSKIHLVIYRIRERGLEIFMPEGEGPSALPEGDLEKIEREVKTDAQRFIQLDEAAAGAGSGYALEADYHDIPSLKGLLAEDARKLASHLRDLDPERGSFVVLKDAARRLMPAQYKMLSELRDILVDRHSTRDI